MSAVGGSTMKRTQFWRCVSAVLLCGILMTSCAAGITGGPGTAGPTPSAAPLDPQTVSKAPVEACAPFLPSASCSPYASVSGTANGKNLPWLASGAVTVQLTTVAGSLQLAVKTPCNPVGGPATISGNTLHVGDIAVGAMGCADGAGAQEQWVLQFLQRPIEMTSAGGALNWTSGPDTLTLRAN
ncbi:heat shock protein HslJ [Arthrobacter sp. ES3-54]|jgi:heat shock protein HslJ|nr:heat shock protein HslJ [Arthrobacter sp. ES3-54]